jgi:hypothetical protein
MLTSPAVDVVIRLILLYDDPHLNYLTLVSYLFPQSLSRPAHSGFHRSQRTTGDLGDLFITKAFYLPQHQNNALLIGQTPEGLLYQSL